MSRREKLEALLADEPGDTFLRYALAMEWANEDENEKSLAIYDDLMAETPPYVPAFFMAGQQLAELDRNDEAREILTRGIQHAQTQGDLHAAGEMTEFRETLD